MLTSKSTPGLVYSQEGTAIRPSSRAKTARVEHLLDDREEGFQQEYEASLCSLDRGPSGVGTEESSNNFIYESSNHSSFVRKLNAYCSATDADMSKPPLVVHGPTGCGKSAFVANWLRKRREANKSKSTSQKEFIFSVSLLNPYIAPLSSS